MSLYRIARAAFVLFCLSVGTAWASSSVFSSSSEPEFLDAADVFTLDEIRQEGDGYVAQGHIAEQYYVYRHALKLVDGRGKEVELSLPQGTAKHDEFFGDTEIYVGDALRLRFPLSVSGPATLHWQGCAQAGICYPPQTMTLNVPAAADTSSVAGVSASSPADGDQRDAAVGAATNVAEDQAAAQRLAALGPVSGTLLFFGFGLLLAFTPCMLPMIPIFSTMIVGSRAKPRRAFVLSMFYVLTMAATYAVVGVAAGLAGANLQATLQSPWLLGAFAALFLVLASSLFGLFELRLPSVLINRVESAGRGHSGGSVAGAAALGFFSALLVGPCMTAPLAGALLYIGQTGSAVYGGLALFALGLGMGLPLLAIAVFGARVLPKPGAWMDRVRVVFGYVMVGMAIMMLDRFFVRHGKPGALGSLATVYRGRLDRLGAGRGGKAASAVDLTDGGGARRIVVGLDAGGGGFGGRVRITAFGAFAYRGGSAGRLRRYRLCAGQVDAGCGRTPGGRSRAGPVDPDRFLCRLVRQLPCDRA